MDRTKAMNLREKLQAHLNDFGSEHNLSLTVGNGSMTNSTVTFKVELAEVAESGEVMNREREAFKKFASQYGLSPDDLDKTFTRDNSTYKIVGLLTKSHKYPILCEIQESKKCIKMPEDSIKFYLKRS